MNMSIHFPNLGIHLAHVGKTVTLFGIDFAYYGIIIAIGMAIAVWLICREAARTGQDEDFYFYTILLSILVGIIGARAYYVVFSWDYYSQNPAEILNIRGGGLAIYGGILFGTATACICARVKRMPLKVVLDTACIGLPVGQCLGRWGNFFNREAFGGYTDGLFAMQLPVNAVREGEITAQMWDHIVRIDGVPFIQVHPTFLYESLWNLGVLCLLLWLRKRRRWDGELFITYLFAYGLGRVWIEGLRTDQLLIPGLGLPVSQVLSAVIVVVCVLYGIWRRKTRKHENTI